jgi:hypothetical protein
MMQKEVNPVGVCDVQPRNGGGSVEILVSEESSLENLKEAVGRIVLQVGTIECGIAGYDLSIRTEREARSGNEEEVAPGVKAIIHSR